MQVLLVLGGSVLAVATAVRLANQGHSVTVIHTGRRLGLFPFAVLTKTFLSEIGVEPQHHSEAEINACNIDGRSLRLATTLYLCRTTPLLEDALSYNEIKFSHKMPHDLNDEVVDCNPRPLKGLKAFQAAFVTTLASEPRLTIKTAPSRHVSATVHSEKIAVSYTYAVNEAVKPAGLIAFSERQAGYMNADNGKLSPVVCVAGQDVAETIVDRRLLMKNVKVILDVLQGYRPPYLEQLLNILP